MPTATDLRACLPVVLLLAALAGGCSDEEQAGSKNGAPVQGDAAAAVEVTANPLRDAYFGNFHVHTSYSFDGYTNGCPTDPDDAYRWARGEAIPGGGGGGDLRIKVPLDWYVVSDHAEYLGVFKLMEDPASPFSRLDLAERVTSDDQKVAFEAYSEILNDLSAGRSNPQLSDPEVSRTIWQDVVRTADRHYRPGRFTTFPAFEWTSNPGQRNLHRVVVFQSSRSVPSLPFSALDSDRPEDLWEWMETTRAEGATLLAIPHNGNASDGLMFPDADSDGNPLTPEYAASRARNEPLYEVTQIKGTSETHPALSPNDEFAGFELWDYTLSADARPPTHRVGSYAREALVRGLAMEAEGRGNPYKFGLIGDSDTHNSASTVEEDNYTGKFAMENSPAHRLEGPKGFAEANKRQIREFSSGGLAGVWAESNTREAIFAALVRKETFATSGTRMKVRFFGGWGFSADMLEDEDWVRRAHDQGVPMGGDLGPVEEGDAPTFVVHSIKEPSGANLDRIQIVKGWVADGEPHERIYDVALSDGRTVGAAGDVPAVGNTVDLKTATYANSIGDVELAAVWTDPDFEPSQPAVYYARVIEIPTPRWSTYDAVTLGIEPRDDLPATIQERAWTSPIWYTP